MKNQPWKHKIRPVGKSLEAALYLQGKLTKVGPTRDGADPEKKVLLNHGK